MIAGHQGYVLIQTDNYNETSVTGLAIIMILTMVVLFAIEWLLRRIFRTGAYRGWFVAANAVARVSKPSRRC
jgi:HemY protein